MATVDQKIVLEALKVLTVPVSEKTGLPEKSNGGRFDTRTGEEDCTVLEFDKILAGNLSALDTVIEENDKYSALRIIWEKYHLSELSKPDSTRWKYIQYCLRLLTILTESLETVARNYQLEQATADQGAREQKPIPNRAPPLPPDVLSVSQQKTVLTTIQFIVCLGVCPYLQPGVGVPVELRSGLGKFVSITTQECLSALDKESRLLSSVEVLLRCIKQPSLGALVLSRHLGDVLAILLQICYRPTPKIGAVGANSKPVTPNITTRGGNSSQLQMPLVGQSSTPATAVDTVVAHQEKPDSAKSSEISHGIRNIATNQRTQENRTGLLRFENDLPINKKQSVTTDSDMSGQTKDSGSITIESRSDMSTKTGVIGEIGTGQCVSRPISAESEDREYYRSSLKTLTDHVYQPLLVKELLLLQGGPSPLLLKKLMQQDPDQQRKKCVNAVPKPPMLAPAPAWLRKACGHLLTETLMKPQGVHHVLRGMLDEPGGPSDLKSSDWRRCDAVAKVIAHCPKQSSVEEYYQHIAPQILGLLDCQDRNLRGQFLRVACSVINIISSQCPDLTHKYVLKPLLEPLYLCLDSADIPQDEELEAVVGEEELNRCVEHIHKVFVCGLSPQAPVFSCLQPHFHALFKLFCHVKSSTSHLRTAVQEILVSCLKQLERSVAISSLKVMLYDQIPPGGSHNIQLMHSGIIFTPGENGGVVAVTRKEESPPDDLNKGCEVRVGCLVSLLKDLEKDGLAGEFFLTMLKELTNVIREQTDGDLPMMPQSVAPGQELREVESRLEGVSRFDHQLLTLSLLAHVCETLGPSCLRNTQHVLQFVQATLERGVQVCTVTEDQIFGVFESETITMAMGLLTAILSGALQVDKGDRERMLELCPLLEKIEQGHPDESVVEMAADLRIAIATHGAVWSSTLSKSRTEKILKSPSDKKKTTGGQKEKKSNPKIELLDDPGIDDADICITGQDIANQTCGNSLVQELKGSEELDKNPDLSFEKSRKSSLLQAFDELCDPLIPVRGHALITLRTLIQNRDGEALKNQAAILKIFQENLAHSDSYLYLAAVNGLATMANLYPDQVVKQLSQELMQCNESDRKGRTSVEMQLKLGECLVRACRNLGDLLPKYKDILLPVIFLSTKDNIADVRASSLSKLGEICKLLRFSLGNHIHEIFTCCGSMLKSDADVEVRKAAGLVITMMLQGLGRDSVTVLDVILKELYRLLKFCQTVEKDEGVQLHVRLALGELDEITRAYLFPKQTLTKKILVTEAE